MITKDPLTAVTKSEGVIVPFSTEKVRQSLARSGASAEVIEMVIDELHKRVYPNMPTRIIEKIAFRLLKKFSRPVAARYHLKRALFELGPSGFPFEKYVAELFSYAGFSTATNQLMKGHCVTHEVDVVAVQQSRYHIIECKYHQQAGARCDVKIPLYIQARFKDIEWQWMQTQGKDALQVRDGW